MALQQRKREDVHRLMKPHGIDFGRWTQWRRPENPPQPIDFVVAGITSGRNKVASYEANKPALLKEKRLMAYHFYESGTNWLPQAESFLRTAEELPVRRLWWDYERSGISTLDKRTALETAEALNWLGQRFPRVGIYANIYDFVALFQKFVPQTAREVEWWISYPGNDPNLTPPWKWSWGEPDRPFSSCNLYQYSWKGDAQAYGATNTKKEMDLNVYQGDNLDAWLGIKNGEEPTQPNNLKERLIGVRNELDDIIGEL